MKSNPKGYLHSMVILYIIHHYSKKISLNFISHIKYTFYPLLPYNPRKDYSKQTFLRFTVI